MKTATKTNRALIARLREVKECVGLDWKKVSKRLKLQPSTVTQIVSGSRDATLEQLFVIATTCGVDPRWLITGKESRASEAAQKLFRRAIAPGSCVIQLLAMCPEVDLGPGMCCYCGCTDAHGCGDCEWVDKGHTICSACLINEEAE